MTPIRMTKRRLLAAALPLTALLAAAPTTATAQERVLRQWVDENGVTHLTQESARKAASRSSSSAKANGQRIPLRNINDWDVDIALAAEMYSIPVALVRAVILAESNFDPNAVSRAGAQGLMQLMPKTAEAMSVVDAFDPVQNIYGGTRYLRILANKFDGDLVKTLAAYNAGPAAVLRAGGVPNYKETQEYVRRVLRFYERLSSD